MTAPAQPPPSVLFPALDQALGGVRRQHARQRRRAALRRGLLVAALALLGLGLARVLTLAPLALAVAVPVALGMGLLAGTLLLRNSALTPLDAARLSDRRAALDGLLTTALTLRAAPTLPLASSPEWEAALRERVLAQAGAAAAVLRPEQIVPAAPRRVWSWPAGVLGLALFAWVVPPLPVRPVMVTVPPAAVVGEGTPVPPPATPGPAADVSGAPIVNEPEPEPQAAVQPTAAQGPSDPGPGSSTAPVSNAVSGQGGTAAQADSGAPVAPSGQGPQPREARQPVGAGTEGAVTTNSVGGGTGTRDTPFGSRESGDFQNQSVTSPDRLAAAPYDPATAPGATPMQQQSDPGSSGLRSASGGRGIESEGADKCVEGCLTNDDMNRGAPADPSRPRAPGGETASGTSDSGSGAAAGSSGVGLGVGTLQPLQSRTRTELGGAPGESADRLQVLAAPRQERRPPTSSPSAQTGGGAWTRTPEAPSASASSIPDSARATVRAYFERTQP